MKISLTTFAIVTLTIFQCIPVEPSYSVTQGSLSAFVFSQSDAAKIAPDQKRNFLTLHPAQARQALATLEKCVNRPNSLLSYPLTRYQIQLVGILVERRLQIKVFAMVTFEPIPFEELKNGFVGTWVLDGGDGIFDANIDPDTNQCGIHPHGHA